MNVRLAKAIKEFFEAYDSLSGLFEDKVRLLRSAYNYEKAGDEAAPAVEVERMCTTNTTVRGPTKLKFHLNEGYLDVDLIDITQIDIDKNFNVRGINAFVHVQTDLPAKPGPPKVTLENPHL